MKRLIPAALLAAATTVAAVAVGVGSADARPAHPLFIEITKLSPTVASVSVSCPTDPPDTLFVSAVLPGDTFGTLLGSIPADDACDGTLHKVKLPLNQPHPRLVRGEVLTQVFLSMSGDGGEVDNHYASLVVR